MSRSHSDALDASGPDSGGAVAVPRRRFGLLPRILVAIVAGVLVGLVAPTWLVQAFATFNGLFSNFLGFIVPVLILALVAPAIGDIGRGAGKLLALTGGIAYGSTLVGGFGALLVLSLIHISEPTRPIG